MARIKILAKKAQGLLQIMILVPEAEGKLTSQHDLLADCADAFINAFNTQRLSKGAYPFSPRIQQAGLDGPTYR